MPAILLAAGVCLILTETVLGVAWAMLVTALALAAIGSPSCDNQRAGRGPDVREKP
jgi:hypothetical protein